MTLHNKKLSTKLLFILCLGFAITSCKKDPDPGNLKVRFEAKFNNEPFEVGAVYEDQFGHRIRADIFKTYISELNILSADEGSEKLIDVDLLDFENSHEYTFELESGTYNSISIGMGVPSSKNKDQDPNQYPNDHPLSVLGSEGMFWFWNTGYIFTKYEGKVDLTGTEGAELVDPFAFHCGEDFLYETLNFGNINLNIESNEERQITFVFHVEKFLENENYTIDLETDFITHTSGNVELAEKFMDCFNDAVTISID